MTVHSTTCVTCNEAFVVWDKDFNCDSLREECRACECKRNGHLFTIYDDGRRHCLICNKPRVSLALAVQVGHRWRNRAETT